MKNPLRHLIPRHLRPYNYLQSLITEAVRDGIVSGPFQGMSYVDQAVCGSLYPKLLGTYERELHPIILEIMKIGIRTVIDIGAAEGYYACGLARRLPDAKIIAFEADLKGRYLLERNIALNCLEDRVTVRGFCDAPLLTGALERANQPVLIICDAEGNEYDLLSPLNVPALRDCWVLVELHDFLLPGITDIIKKRFAATHKVNEIQAQLRTRNDFQLASKDRYVKWLPSRYLDIYLSELRPQGMRWLWMIPMNGSSDS